MNTALDDFPYQQWYLASFSYQDNVLMLDVARLQVAGDHDVSPRYVVVFGDVRYFQVYDEVAHRTEALAGREGGVLGWHASSNLIKHLKETTDVLNAPGEFKHFSLMTGDEFVHVVTRSEPSVTRAA